MRMRFVFDTNVLIGYLRNPHDPIPEDALLRAADRGEAFVTLISLLELYLARDKRKDEVHRQVIAVQKLCKKLGVKIISCTSTSQRRALGILKDHQASLEIGLADSLILATGTTMQAHLVTTEKKWFRVTSYAIDPASLLQRF